MDSSMVYNCCILDSSNYVNIDDVRVQQNTIRKETFRGEIELRSGLRNQTKCEND